MRFQVPQFIEVEDKIFGPFTVKQFIYLVGGAGISFTLYRFIPLPFFLKIIPISVVIALSVALAFAKINNKPFIFMLEAAVKYFFNSKLYIWRKEDKAPQKTSVNLEGADEYASIMVPKISNSKLKDLTWSLDIKESLYSNKNQK